MPGAISMFTVFVSGPESLRRSYVQDDWKELRGFDSGFGAYQMVSLILPACRIPGVWHVHVK
jgi:hypothetical protein